MNVWQVSALRLAYHFNKRASNIEQSMIHYIEADPNFRELFSRIDVDEVVGDDLASTPKAKEKVYFVKSCVREFLKYDLPSMEEE